MQNDQLYEGEVGNFYMHKRNEQGSLLERRKMTLKRVVVLEG